MEQFLSDILNFLLSILTGMINAIFAFGNWLTQGILWFVNTHLAFFEWLFNTITSIPGFFGGLIVTAINTAVQLVGGVFVIIFMVIHTGISFVIDMVNNIIKVIAIVRMVIEVGLAIAGLMFNYLGQVVNLMIGMYGGISVARPVAIPGLPLCITAPLDSDWCAIWYITDWTLLAPGTPGANIIPILVLIIDLFIIAYVVRSIFKLVRWFQSIYQVT